MCLNILDADITVDEINTAIDNANKGKASGIDEIHVEFLVNENGFYTSCSMCVSQMEYFHRCGRKVLFVQCPIQTCQMYKIQSVTSV